jgi:hypothetical protein
VNLTRGRSRQQDGALCYNRTKSKPRKDALAKIAVPFAIFPVTFVVGFAWNYGTDPENRKLAEQIIVEREKEVMAMLAWPERRSK